MKTTVKTEILSWIKTGIIAFILFLILNFFILTARVDGASMEPNFSNGDTLIVNRLAYKNTLPQYSDIIVFDCETKGAYLIKRVIGLPGDHIEIKDGKVYRNEVELNEQEYISCETNGNIDEIIKDNHIFVMGDNRPNSADSRIPQVGQIKIEDIKGKVQVRLFPNPQKF